MLLSTLDLGLTIQVNSSTEEVAPAMPTKPTCRPAGRLKL